MITWTSNPEVPHTGATFNFPTNKGEEPIDYTITCTDDYGCTTSMTYTVKTGTTCQPKPIETCSASIHFNNNYAKNIKIKLVDVFTNEVCYTYQFDESFTELRTLQFNDGESRIMRIGYFSVDEEWNYDWEVDQIVCGTSFLITLTKTVTVWGRYKSLPPTLGYFDVVDSNGNAYEMPFNLHIKYYVYVSPTCKCGCGQGIQGSCHDGPYYLTIETDTSEESEPYVCNNSDEGHISYNYRDCGGSDENYPTRISVDGINYDTSVTKNGLTVYLKTECPF